MAVPRPRICSLPFRRHFSQLMQSRMREMFRNLAYISLIISSRSACCSTALGLLYRCPVKK